LVSALGGGEIEFRTGMRIDVEDSRTGKLIKLQVQEHHSIDKILEIVKEQTNTINSEYRAFALVLNGREVPSGISIDEIVRKFGLKEGDVLKLWPVVVGGAMKNLNGVEHSAIDELTSKIGYLNLKDKNMRLFVNPTYQFLESIRTDPDTIAYWKTLPNRYLAKGLPSKKGLSEEMGLGKGFLKTKYDRIKNLGKSEELYFSSIQKIETFLKKFKNNDQVQQIIYDYADRLGSQHRLVFDISRIFFKYTQIPISIEGLSLIIYKDGGKLNSKILERNFFGSFFELEYLISRADLLSNSKLLPNKDIKKELKKYLSDPVIVEKIKEESRDTIRKFLLDKEYISRSMDSRVFNLIWDSLYALSDVKTTKMRAITGSNDLSVAVDLGDLGEIIVPNIKNLETRRAYVRLHYFSRLSLPDKKTVKNLRSELYRNYLYSPATVMEAVRSCNKYLKTRFTGDGYNEYWQDESVKGYHITMGLARNLGFDILHFQSLDGTIFSIFSRNKYSRHHFRNEWNRKKSILIQDIILTDDHFHNSYAKYTRTLNGEQSIENILKAFEEFMLFDRDVTETDVQQTFKKLGEEWVYHLWKSQGQKEFEDNLIEFNKRKDVIKAIGIEEFIKNYYKLAYDRFYGQYDIGIAETFARMPGAGDYLPGSSRYLGTLT